MKRILDTFSVSEIVLIALIASLGIAVKPVVVPIAHVISGPLFIPGGSIAGGFYMLFLVIGPGLINKRWTATLIALTQAFIIMGVGIFGSHGAVSLLTYTLPGILVDVFLILFKKSSTEMGTCFMLGMVANMTGTFLSNLVFFKLPVIPLALSISAAALSGGLGGIIAYRIIVYFNKHINFINKENEV